MSSFNLNTGQGRSLRGFENRSSDVFGSLGGLEKNYDEAVKERGPDEFIDEDRRESPERDFKKPAPPRPDSGRGRSEHGSRGGWDRPRWRGRGGRSSYRGGRGRQNKTPDHEVHPERWTEYSLEDTDISGESSNKRAAVDFLRDLRKRKADEQHPEEWDAKLHCGKVEYKKPVLKTTTDKSDRDGKRQSYGDVHKMAEFQFGQSKPKVRKPNSSEASGSGSCIATSDSISLGHLGEEEEASQSESSSRQTDQSSDCRIHPIQSDSHEKTIENNPEEGKESQKSSGDGRSETEMPIFQRKAGKGKRHIRGRKTEEEDDQ